MKLTYELSLFWMLDASKTINILKLPLDNELMVTELSLELH